MSTSIPEHIFREYDIRGTVGTEITEDFAWKLGRAYANTLEASSEPVSIGHDCRESSPGLARALAEGIASTGRAVRFHGVGATPQLYFSVFTRPSSGGIQVTGSHNPPDMNGFKILKGKQTQSGKEIQELKQGVLALTVDRGSFTPEDGATIGEITDENIQDEYLNALVENSKPHMGDRKIKVVVDAGNGVGGIVGPELMRQIGCEVIELYCEPDGQFPNHHPDPTVLENIVDLQAAVREHKADVGIGWDGDADRIGVVDENGDVIFGDMLLLIYGRALASEVDSPTVIGDVKCSSRLFDELEKAGASAIMWKTGHSLIKKKLAEEGAELGGEMSGHIFFKHRFFGFDDALYSSARFVEILSKTDSKCSELLSDIPTAVATPEIRVDCPEEIKFLAPEKLEPLFKDYPCSTMDGIRIEFPEGWGLVRASNTQPVLVLRFEASNESLLKEYQDKVEKSLAQVIEEITAAAN